MSSKADYVCSYCSKIFKNPIILPCFHNICEHHLKETNVLKDKSIKCETCKFDINLKTYRIKPNKHAKILLDQESYLSEEEKCSKNLLIEDLKKLMELNKSFEDQKNDLDMKSKNHFKDIRDQMKSSFNQAIAYINKYYSDMKEKVKNAEISCLSRINISNMDISHETKFKNFNETFLEPNLTIESINQMNQKQQLEMKKIQLEIDKLGRLKDNLKISNI